MKTLKTREWDVVIAGAGPTGLTLANYLGLYAVRTLLLERLPQLVDYPRGVGMDDETLRSFQAIGLVERVRKHTVPHQIMRFIDAQGRILAAINPTAQPFGWPRRSGFIQPLVDAQLHAGLSRFSGVQVQFGRSVESFVDEDGGVSVTVQPVDAEGRPDGAPHVVRTRFLVGCDGGRSPVRSALGLPFDGKSESTRWLVIDIGDDPVGSPNVSLVLDKEFPYVELGLPHGIRRFEFMVPDAAHEGTYDDPAQVRALLARVLPQAEDARLIRHRVYTHHARIAPTFRRGNVFIAGDAAHLMPVWQGQGFNTGIRDATNLSWKLGLVVRNKAAAHLLDSYTQERHAHAAAMIDLSVLVGRIFVPSSRWLRLLRDIVAPGLSRFARLRQYIAEMRFKPMPFFAQGAVVHRGRVDPSGPVGRMFIQPRVRTGSGKLLPFDDVVGPRFALLSWSARADAWIGPAAAQVLATLDAVRVVVRPDCQDLEHDPPSGGLVVADADGAFKAWFDTAPASVVVLRPDKVVAAVCRPCDLGTVLAELAAVLHLQALPAVAADQIPNLPQPVLAS